MNFKQWCHSIGIEETRISKHDMVSMEVLKKCWDYQQEQIGKLKKQSVGKLKFQNLAHNRLTDLNRYKKAIEEIKEFTSYEEKDGSGNEVEIASFWYEDIWSTIDELENGEY